MAEKRFFWLKLPKDFFQSKEIKRLRRIAGGDTYTIIYLKLLLKSLDTDGKLYFEGIEDSFADEISLDIDEEPDNVQVTINYLLSKGLMTMSDTEAYMEKYPVMVGSESESAERVRRFRERQKERLLQSNEDPLHCNERVTPQLRPSNVEIEKDTDKDKEKEIEKESEVDKINTSCSELPKRKPSQKQSTVYADVRPVILNDGSEWRPDIDLYQNYQELYPAVDIDREFAKMNQWCEDNKAKRKTKNGVRRFVTHWLSGEQDKYHGGSYQSKPHKTAKQAAYDDGFNWYMRQITGGDDEQAGNSSDPNAAFG